MSIIDTSFTVANKTDKDVGLFIVEQDMQEQSDERISVSFKSHSIQSSPNSIQTTSLNLSTGSVLIGVINESADILDDNISMTKKVEIPKSQSVRILVKSNNSIEIM